MNKQKKQQIIDDFKEVIWMLKYEIKYNKFTYSEFICINLMNCKNSEISLKYFDTTKIKAKAKNFTLSSKYPESWTGRVPWWTFYYKVKLSIKDKKIYPKYSIKQIMRLKIQFLESLIEELKK